MSELLEAALTYVRRGWYVFPCETAVRGDKHSGKAPLLGKGGWHHATLDERVVRAWWGRWPTANVAIATNPSGLVVLDVDSKDGARGFESLAEFAHELPDTLKAQTGSGALHAIYLRGDHFAATSNRVGSFGGIEIIGNGYILAAPSNHYSGGTYRWLNPSVLPVDVPPVLRSMQRSRAETSTPVEIVGAHCDQPSKVRAALLIAEAFPAKGRHFTFLALAGSLAQEGWSEAEIVEFTQLVASKISNTDQKAIDDRVPQARDSVDKVSRGEEVAGWGALAASIPQATIDAVHEHLGISNHEFDWTVDLGPLGMITPQDVHKEIVSLKNPAILWIGDLAEREFPPVLSYPTQFPELNRLLGGGISTQMLTILLGKPGAGKTAMFMAIALHFGLGIVPVLYVSTELQHNELVARLASPLLRAPWRDIVRGKAKLPDGTTITNKHCAAILKQYKIAIIAQDAIYQAGDKAVELIARTALAIKEERGQSPIVMVDYLQELARGDDLKARQQNTKVAVLFRMLSQRLDCAFFCVSSVSRAGYGKAAQELRQADNPEVYLALAKESGDIDYAAASIMFLDVVEESDGNGWKMGRMALAKSRHGETGFAGLRFHGAYGVWEDFAGGVKALSDESRSGARVEQAIVGLKERVLNKVREFSLLGADPNGNTSLKSKSEMKVLIGGNVGQVNIALDQMIRDGIVIERSEETQNPVTRRISVRKVIALPPDGYAKPSEKPIDVAATLAGIVDASKV